MSVTSTDGLSFVAITATVPAISRTCSAVTSSKSRLIGVSTVQCGMAVPPGDPSTFSYDISRTGEVKMYRVSGAIPRTARAQALETPGDGTRTFGITVFVLFFVVRDVGVGVRVQPRQPGREPVDRGLELRVQVDEIPQPLGEPGHRDLLVAAAVVELLDPLVGEVHR